MQHLEPTRRFLDSSTNILDFSHDPPLDHFCKGRGRRTREWVATDKILFMNDDAVMKFNSDEMLTSIPCVCNTGMRLAVFLTLQRSRIYLQS